MAMPETAVNEDHSAEPRKYQIGASRHIWRMKSVAEAARMKGAPDQQLGLRVLAFDTGHHPAAGLLIDYIRQRLGAPALPFR